MSTMWRSKAHPQPVSWWIVLLEGIVALIVGLCLLIAPGTTTLVLVQFLGFYWLISGILSLVSLFVDRSLRGWKTCVGILGILSGLIVIRHPVWSSFLLPFTLVIILGILGLAQGLAKFVEAFQGSGVGAVLLGIVDVIFGIILLTSRFMAPFAFALAWESSPFLEALLPSSGLFACGASQRLPWGQPSFSHNGNFSGMELSQFFLIPISKMHEVMFACVQAPRRQTSLNRDPMN